MGFRLAGRSVLAAVTSFVTAHRDGDAADDQIDRLRHGSRRRVTERLAKREPAAFELKRPPRYAGKTSTDRGGVM
jgi:hypothetical protein